MRPRLELREVVEESERPAQVDRIRRWYHAYWLLLASFPLLALLAPLAIWIVGAEWAAMVPVIPWFVALVVVQVRTNTFLCPRCGEPIRPISAFHLPWDVRCPGCDLRISRPSA
jgi:hypothetical protein